MYCGRMVFGDVVSLVVWTRSPIDIEFSLFVSITDPMESRVKASRFLLAYIVVYDSMCGGIVHFDGCSGFRLLVA